MRRDDQSSFPWVADDPGNSGSCRAAGPRTGCLVALGAALLGALVGAALALALVGRQVDELRLEREELLVRLEDQRDQLQRLEESVKARRWLPIRELVIDLNLEDRVKRLRAEEAVRNLLRDLVGKNVADVDPIMVWRILDDRVVTTPAGQFRLRLRLMVIWERSMFVIEAEEQADGGQGP